MILFRADGNSEIGSGHMMRCLSIADAAAAHGEKRGGSRQCLFACAGNEFEEVIRLHGCGSRIFHTDYTDLKADLPAVQSLIDSLKPQALFVDSYYVTESYLSALHKTCREAGCRLVYIDDLLSFAYPCDILLNYNIYGPDQESEYKAKYARAGIKLPKLLLGTSYVPLRAEFQNLKARAVKKQAVDILISTGGADLEHMLRNMAEYLVKGSRRFGQFRFHFVVGAMNQDRKEIEAAVKGMDFIMLHYNVRNMAELMLSCDLAVSAAGSTLYELCAAQVPAITYVLADNQMPGALGFQRRGILKYAGDARKDAEAQPGQLIEAAVQFAADFEGRAKTAQKLKSVADGKGARRIIEAL